MIFTNNFPGIVVIEHDGVVVFNGKASELTQLIKDTKSMAEAIRADIDQPEGINDNDTFDYEQYQEFSKKY